MTVPITLQNVTSFQNDTTAATTVNNNSAAIVTALGNALDTAGDQMLGTLDMNSNRILNLPAPNSAAEPARLQDLATVIGGGTITVPTFSGGTNITITGAAPAVIATTANPTFATSVTTPQVKNSTGVVTIPATGTVTIPAATDTLVGRATTDTLTNKTLTAPVISTITNTGTLTLPTTTDTIVGRATTDTLTNKTLTSPTLVTPTLGAATATSITFSPSTGGVVGTVTNDDASAGKVGEYVSASVSGGSAVSLTTNVAATITSISLTAGDWDVEAIGCFNSGSTTVLTQAGVCLNTTAAAYVSAPTHGNAAWVGSFTGPGVFLGPQMAVPSTRFSLATTTTIYLIGFAVFTTSTCGGYGLLRARRVR